MKITKLIRSMKSKAAYLKRKRDAQQHRIAEAEAMVGRKIEVRASQWYLVPGYRLPDAVIGTSDLGILSRGKSLCP